MEEWNPVLCNKIEHYIKLARHRKTSTTCSLSYMEIKICWSAIEWRLLHIGKEGLEKGKLDLISACYTDVWNTTLNSINIYNWYVVNFLKDIM
jgi:hypothetical protein